MHGNCVSVSQFGNGYYVYFMRKTEIINIILPSVKGCLSFFNYYIIAYNSNKY